jgi:hypothetical protein
MVHAIGNTVMMRGGACAAEMCLMGGGDYVGVLLVYGAVICGLWGCAFLFLDKWGFVFSVVLGYLGSEPV